MVKKPGSQARVRRFKYRYLLDSQAGWPGCCINVCVALWRAVNGPSAIERPLKTIREEEGIYPGSVFLSVSS